MSLYLSLPTEQAPSSALAAGTASVENVIITASSTTRMTMTTTTTEFSPLCTPRGMNPFVRAATTTTATAITASPRSTSQPIPIQSAAKATATRAAGDGDGDDDNDYDDEHSEQDEHSQHERSPRLANAVPVPAPSPPVPLEQSVATQYIPYHPRLTQTQPSPQRPVLSQSLNPKSLLQRHVSDVASLSHAGYLLKRSRLGKRQRRCRLRMTHQHTWSSSLPHHGSTDGGSPSHEGPLLCQERANQQQQQELRHPDDHRTATTSSLCLDPQYAVFDTASITFQQHQLAVPELPTATSRQQHARMIQDETTNNAESDYRDESWYFASVLLGVSLPPPPLPSITIAIQPRPDTMEVHDLLENRQSQQVDNDAGSSSVHVKHDSGLASALAPSSSLLLTPNQPQNNYQYHSCPNHSMQGAAMGSEVVDSFHIHHNTDSADMAPQQQHQHHPYDTSTTNFQLFDHDDVIRDEHDPEAIWHVQYCVLEGGTLYFYRNKTDAESPEAHTERRQQQYLEHHSSVITDDHHHHPQWMVGASSPIMANHMMMHMADGSLGAPAAAVASEDHIWEKRVDLDSVGTVRQATTEYGPNTLELSSSRRTGATLRHEHHRQRKQHDKMRQRAHHRADSDTGSDEEYNDYRSKRHDSSSQDPLDDSHELYEHEMHHNTAEESEDGDDNSGHFLLDVDHIQADDSDNDDNDDIADGDDKLVLRARNADEMNEWLFQFHRAIATFVRNMMDHLVVVAAAAPPPPRPGAAGPTAAAGMTHHNTTRIRMAAMSHRASAMASSSLALSPLRRSMVAAPARIERPTATKPTTPSLKPPGRSSAAVARTSPMSFSSTGNKNNSPAFFTSSSLHSATVSPLRRSVAVLPRYMALPATTTAPSLSHGHGRSSLHRRRINGHAGGSGSPDGGGCVPSPARGGIRSCQSSGGSPKSGTVTTTTVPLLATSVPTSLISGYNRAAATSVLSSSRKVANCSAVTVPSPSRPKHLVTPSPSNVFFAQHAIESGESSLTTPIPGSVVGNTSGPDAAAATAAATVMQLVVMGNAQAVSEQGSSVANNVSEPEGQTQSPEFSAPCAETPETERPPPSKGRYLPPHIRRQQQQHQHENRSVALSEVATPRALTPPKPKYVPPHLRNNDSSVASISTKYTPPHMRAMAVTTPDPSAVSYNAPTQNRYIPRHFDRPSSLMGGGLGAAGITATMESPFPHDAPQLHPQQNYQQQHPFFETPSPITADAWNLEASVDHMSFVAADVNDMVARTIESIPSDDTSSLNPSEAVKLGGCADPNLVVGSIVDPQYIPRRASRLGKVPSDPFGYVSAAVNQTSTLRWEIGAVSECGVRESNEDCYLIVGDLSKVFDMEGGNDNDQHAADKYQNVMTAYGIRTNRTVWDALHHPAGLFAVFDGHCGDQAARFAAEKLPGYIFDETTEHQLRLQQQQQQQHRTGDMSVAMQENEEGSASRSAQEYVQDILQGAIRNLDTAFCSLCVEQGRSWESGTTALVVALVNHHLVIANLGDARGILCRTVSTEDNEQKLVQDGWSQLPLEGDEEGEQQHDPRSAQQTTCFWKQVTDVHSPGCEDERQRIQAANGWVTTEKEIPIGQLKRMDLFDQDVLDILQRCFADRYQPSSKAAAPQRILHISRVCGELAVSRAIGDRDFKAACNLPASTGSNSNSSAGESSEGLDNQTWDCSLYLPYPDHHSRRFVGDLVTNVPDFQAIQVGRDGFFDEFLLLACDGLWDVMDPDDAVRITRDLLYNKQWPAKLAAARLAELAMHLGSSDNITVLVLRFITSPESNME